MVRTPARRPDDIAPELTDLADGRHPDLTMRGRGGQLFDRRPSATFHRDARDAGWMSRRPPLDVLG